jgi:anaerobic magnesium-protoporphyrin IX monomethyl ester cyclase
MLSILICHSYYLQLDRKQLERARPYPPLATLQVAALLRQAGHEVRLFDAMLSAGVAAFEAQLAGRSFDLVLLYEDNFNFLSKMCLAQMRGACLAMIRAARAHGARVIAAGADVSDAPGEHLAAGADLVLQGEGLAALLAVLPRLAGQLTASAQSLAAGLPGVAFLAGGQVQRARGQTLLPQAQLPVLPAWDLVDIARYRDTWQRAHGYFSLNMAGSRGCSFRCAWCAKPIWGNHYLQRGAREVAAEMRHLQERYAPDHIWFADDIFGFRVEWVTALAQALEEMHCRIPFTIQTRADLVSEAMAAALAAAGCREAWLGAESGSERVLKAMNKGTTVPEILAARGRLKGAGVRVGFFIQLGYLEEELPELLATRTLIETAQPDDVGVSVAYPLPGTKFHDTVQEQLGSKTHWEDSGDLDMLFAGAYTADFYRAVRDLLHEQVRLTQLDPVQARRVRSELAERWRALLARAPACRNPARAGRAQALP